MEKKISMEDIDAVFFDVGNTLLEAYPSVEAICLEVIGRHGPVPTLELVRKGLEAADRYYYYRYWADDTFWAKEEEVAQMWLEMYLIMLEEVEVEGDRLSIAREMYSEFGRGDRWRTYPDVIPVMETLQGKGKKIGLISNWDAWLSSLCLDMGLHRYLDCVVASASLGKLKPDPHIFELALSRLGVEPHRAIHVGDQYYADVLGARVAGMHPVMIDRTDSGYQPDCPLVTDLYGLLEYLGL